MSFRNYNIFIAIKKIAKLKVKNNNNNKMNNNYKVVEVYISYCEYSISKLDIIKGDGLDKVVKNVFDNIVDKGEIDLEDEENSMMYNDNFLINYYPGFLA